MALDLGIQEKIRKLKALFAHESPDALRQIEAWETRLRELSALDDYSKLETTKAVVATIRDRLKGVLLRRALGKGLTTEELGQLDAREEELRFVLGRVLPPFESEVEQIEKLVNDELTP